MTSHLGRFLIIFQLFFHAVQINTNGILTFGHEFTEFLNIPFPLEGPTIAPFYSNVDTTLTNDTAQIIFFQSDDELLLNRATRLVQSSFRDARDFRASALFVATWENVGHYNKKNNEQNTFQVIFIKVYYYRLVYLKEIFDRLQ